MIFKCLPNCKLGPVFDGLLGRCCRFAVGVLLRGTRPAVGQGGLTPDMVACWTPPTPQIACHQSWGFIPLLYLIPLSVVIDPHQVYYHHAPLLGKFHPKCSQMRTLRLQTLNVWSYIFQCKPNNCIRVGLHHCGTDYGQTGVCQTLFCSVAVTCTLDTF